MFGKNLKQDIFVSSGFKNWKKALNAFHKHEGTQSHKDCIVSWNSYKASALRGNVVQQIEAASADEIRQRREYMGQCRLHQLAVMAIEKDVVEQLDHNKILNRFATLKERRHRLMVPMKNQ